MASVLEGFGIPTLIVDDGICRLSPVWAQLVGGTTVLVAATDEADALEIIELGYPGGVPHVGSFCSVPLSVWALLGVMLLGWARGPYAWADDIEADPRRDACAT